MIDDSKRMGACPPVPLLLAALVALAVAPHQVRAGTGEGQSDFGGVGLMQTPTARMMEVGRLDFSISRTEPYRRYNLFLQPLDWVELGLSYTQVENRPYGTVAEDRDLIDKSGDLKLRLLQENRYRPQVAVGFRDLGGTTLFGAEYLVASKRWNDFDFSLGVGWGYLGGQDDLGSPARVFGERYEDRPGRAGGSDGGEPALSAMFRGPAAVFGGVEYQTPLEPLQLMVEYEGNDYQSEPQENQQDQDSRFNLGARWRLNDHMALTVGWQRGNTGMVGLSLGANLAELTQVKEDPPPADVGQPAAEIPAQWQPLVGALNDNAGLVVQDIHRDGDEIIVTARPQRFRDLRESEARANRLLHHHLPAGIDTFTYRWQERGVAVRETRHDRALFVAAARSVYEEAPYLEDRQVVDPPPAVSGERLHRSGRGGFSSALRPGIEQNFGGPDGYLYQVFLSLDMEYQFRPSTWVTGALGLTLADNLDKYEYIADSDLPRVRTYIGDYLSESRTAIGVLQLNQTGRLGQDWYVMGYGGLLESMYAGVGGEILYRPLGSPLAVGLDVNRVRQRGFARDFQLRDYEAWTGHLTAYWDTGLQDIHARVSAGRYLAEDWGVTVDLSREFASGVRMGAWATETEARDDFGEGSFDKGIYLSFPFDSFFTRSSRDRANIAWRPLTRDGGAMLQRQETLFDVTQERR
ncbi:YjbH domain-containing protein [Ectothiorhodospira marina]|uniref:Exopolysaccharide biosynthesis protein YbjH n=1 Tax=Ectothiorhodospira marina TaxID=1396821 RepID=A0A1H7LC50_9GAMM|nr:YjbH domain-containing protein [Ectothiorhodospira marina]SEK95917.1 Exopolysaccharide biosynthesis protein YbjH [Ectothiorhodospira marina]